TPPCLPTHQSHQSNLNATYPCDVTSQTHTDTNCSHGNNYTYSNDPRIHGAFNKGRTALGQQHRKQAYIDAQKALADVLPEIPLYQQLTVIAYNKKLQGYKGNELFWLDNAEDWFLSS